MPSPDELRALAERAKELALAAEQYANRFGKFHMDAIVPVIEVQEMASNQRALADAVIDLLAENERLRSENEDCRLALAAVSAGIWRDKERNAKGLAGGSLVVELVEAAIQHQHKGANP